MRALLREIGHATMAPSDMAKFESAFEEGKLLPPEQYVAVFLLIVIPDRGRPGTVIAALAVGGPMELSGEYIEWSDERLAPFRLRA